MEDSIIRGAYDDSALGRSLAFLRRRYNAVVQAKDVRKAAAIAAIACHQTADVQWQTCRQVCEMLARITAAK